MYQSPTYRPYRELKDSGYDLTNPDVEEYVEICRRIDKLIEDIHAAYDGVPRPLTTLHVGRALDDEWFISPQRAEELRLLDPEQTWQEVPKEKIEYFQEYFTFSDPEGWRFYLPAFMLAFLKEFPNNGFVAICSAARDRTHIDLLTKSQLQCLTDFTTLCRQFGIWSP